MVPTPTTSPLSDKNRLIGAHVSASGGLHNAFSNAENIGANAMQIFGASPRQWSVAFPNSDIIDKFNQIRQKSPVKKIFLHASYLVNLGTPNEELYQKSIKNLTAHLKIANALNAEGLIYHIGSYKDTTPQESYHRIASGMLQVLKDAPGKAHLIMENASGGGSKIGITPEEIGEIFHLANHPQIKVCIDTAHAFAAGLLETFTPDELQQLTNRCQQSFGLENLAVLHINDSKAPYNSAKDRHENLGQGHIGLPAFRNLASHPYLSSIPWILEVPGFTGNGPDQENIQIAQSLFAY
ncbi:hypothetical protein CVV38_01220 [Candidatus Peregrinibacteria bacterium HGW-Peregrinibacteria-1]|jgi:deoxyribonuclease-4|nr:MAG: hypothetical protein CVV38_01220 [Candidatus Peregrinibacteria bacterium HGW-Peregrinibacteria-1]